MDWLTAIVPAAAVLIGVWLGQLLTTRDAVRARNHADLRDAYFQTQIAMQHLRKLAGDVDPYRGACPLPPRPAAADAQEAFYHANAYLLLFASERVQVQLSSWRDALNEFFRQADEISLLEAQTLTPDSPLRRKAYQQLPTVDRLAADATKEMRLDLTAAQGSLPRRRFSLIPPWMGQR